MSSKAPAARGGTIDKNEFCRTCARFPTGVTVVTVLDGEGAPHGMTASSFTSVSLDPPLVLVCVDHRAKLAGHLRGAEYVGINVLSEHQRELSERFARRSQDRFEGVDWRPGETGVPLIPGALASLECSLSRLVDAGDHAIVIAEVLHMSHRSGRPLVYFASGYHRLDGAGG